MILHDFTNALIDEYLTNTSNLNEKWEVFDSEYGPAKI